jgi:hypothetical protein
MVVPEQLVRNTSVRNSATYFALTCNRLTIGTHHMGDQMAGACATGGGRGEERYIQGLGANTGRKGAVGNANCELFTATE